MKTAYIIISTAVAACTCIFQASAQMPEGLTVEDKGNSGSAVEYTDSTLSLDIEHLDIDSLSDSYLDSLDINKDIPINDYSMIGFQYGVGISQVSFCQRGMKQIKLHLRIRITVQQRIQHHDRSYL